MSAEITATAGPPATAGTAPLNVWSNALVNDVEVHASRLLTSQVFLSTDGPSHERIREWYNNYREETTRRAAAILLSTLLEFYRLPFTTHMEVFNLMVLSSKHVWRNKLNAGAVTCDSIINEPWEIPTIEEIIGRTTSTSTVCATNPRRHRHGKYEDTCLDIIAAAAAAAQTRYVATTSTSSPRAISRYGGKCGIISPYTINSARAERLYNIAACMLDIIVSGGAV